MQHDKPVLLYYDNQVALHIAANPIFHERSKHIEADCHIVRNRVLDGTIKTFHVASKNQLADVFTKTLGVDNYVRLIKKLGLINIFAANIEFPETARALLLWGGVKTNALCSMLEDASVETSVGQQCKSGATPLAHKFSYKQCEAEASDTKHRWACKDVLETIEAVPYHEVFIHSFGGYDAHGL